MFFSKYGHFWFFDNSTDMADFDDKMLGKVVYDQFWPESSKTQFSTSHPQKRPFSKSRKFTFLWKYRVCGLKFEISRYPKKLPILTYSPYKYEVNRIKTREDREKNRFVFFFPSQYSRKARNMILLDSEPESWFLTHSIA